MTRQAGGELDAGAEVDAGASCVGDLAAVIMLGGSVSNTGLTTAIGRPLLDLPIDDEHTVLQAWSAHLAGLKGALGRQDLPVRLLVDGDSPMPRSTEEAGWLTMERDPAEYRGTAGLLRDVTQDYGEEAFVVIVNAAQVMLEPLAELVDRLASLGGDGALVGHRSGTPTGVTLLRVACLREVSAVGFVDLKEQALPQIASRHEVKVLQTDEPTGVPVRTLSDYVTALRWHHLRRVDETARHRLVREEWQSSFSIVEGGASVGPDVTLRDSVVLTGGAVEAGATLVRTVIGPRGVVRKGRVVTDDVVARTGPRDGVG